MKNSHPVNSTKKGLNCGVRLGLLLMKKIGKQESLNHYRIIMDVANQNALQ